MKIVRAFSLALLCSGLVGAYAQDVSNGYQPVSGMVQPNINTLSQMMGQLRIDKWKLSNESREQMNSYIASINKDLNTTLPNLLSETDQSHGAADKVLAVSRNVDALYDVLLRVAATGEVASPGQQAQVLEQQVIALRDTRQALDDRIQKGVQAQVRTIANLQQQLATAKAAPAPAAPSCPTPSTRKKSTRSKAKSSTK